MLCAWQRFFFRQSLQTSSRKHSRSHVLGISCQKPVRILQKSAEEKAKEQEDGLVKPGCVAPVNALLQQRLTCPEWSHGQRIVLCLPVFAACGSRFCECWSVQVTIKGASKGEGKLGKGGKSVTWKMGKALLLSAFLACASKVKGQRQEQGQGPRSSPIRRGVHLYCPKRFVHFMLLRNYQDSDAEWSVASHASHASRSQEEEKDLVWSEQHGVSNRCRLALLPGSAREFASCSRLI